MSKRLISLVYPEANDPEVDLIEDFKPVTLPSEQPVLSQKAQGCIQSFANATGISTDQVASEAICAWWDNWGGYLVKALEAKAN